MNHPLMPERWGLLLVFACVGLVGGGAASAALSPNQAPPLWDVIRRLVTGLFCGLVAGALAFWKFGPVFDDGEVYLSLAAAAAAGFVGPFALWRFVSARDPRIPPPPDGSNGASP